MVRSVNFNQLITGRAPACCYKGSYYRVAPAHYKQMIATQTGKCVLSPLSLAFFYCSGFDYQTYGETYGDIIGNVATGAIADKCWLMIVRLMNLPDFIIVHYSLELAGYGIPINHACSAFKLLNPPGTNRNMGI